MCVAMGCRGASQWVTPIVMNIQGFALSCFFRQIYQQPTDKRLLIRGFLLTAINYRLLTNQYWLTGKRSLSLRIIFSIEHVQLIPCKPCG